VLLSTINISRFVLNIVFYDILFTQTVPFKVNTFISEAEIRKCGELTHELLVAARAPAGATLHVPSPFIHDYSMPHYRILLLSEDPTPYDTGNIEIFIVSSDVQGADGQLAAKYTSKVHAGQQHSNKSVKIDKLMKRTGSLNKNIGET